MLALYLINWGCNALLNDSLKKSKQFNQSDITSDIAALTVTLSVNGPLYTKISKTETLLLSLHLSVLIPTSDFGPRLDSAGLAYKLHGTEGLFTHNKIYPVTDIILY